MVADRSCAEDYSFLFFVFIDIFIVIVIWCRAFPVFLLARIRLRKPLQLDLAALEPPMDRGVGHPQRPGQPPDAGPGFFWKRRNLCEKLHTTNLFGPAALVLSVGDIPARPLVVGGFQEALPDAFAGLGGDPKGPGGLEEGALAEFVVENAAAAAVAIVAINGGRGSGSGGAAVFQATTVAAAVFQATTVAAAHLVFQEGLEEGGPLFVGEVSTLDALSSLFGLAESACNCTRTRTSARARTCGAF